MSTFIMSLEKIHQSDIAVVNCALQRCVAEVIFYRAVRASPQEYVNALDMTTHAGNVQRRVLVAIGAIQIALCVDKLLHDFVVAPIARLVERVVLVHHRGVRACFFAQKVLADLGAVVTHSPVEGSDRKLFSVFEQVVDLLIDAVESALEECDGSALVPVLHSFEQLVVFQVVSHFF